jgi:hypothetical protein
MNYDISYYKQHIFLEDISSSFYQKTTKIFCFQFVPFIDYRKNQEYISIFLQQL